ncbi:MAG TPA: MFS transporter [Reyranella sp.]|nr:MFS transporter [Reyranella sp.]
MSTAASAEPGPFLRLLQRVVAVRPEEAPAVGWCWLYAFALLAANYILTPIRDQMAIAGDVRNLKWLFTATLIGTILFNIPFAWLVKRLPRSRFIPLTYRFLAVLLLLFGAALHIAGKEQTIWIGRVFFIWVSITNLLAISVFWQLNVDLFKPEQGKRLFSFIAAGATIGAIVGSAFISGFARTLSTPVLLIAAAVLFEVAVFCAGRLGKLSPALHHRPQAAEERAIGGGVLAGILHTFRSPYLLGVSVFLLLYSVTSTFAYSQQQFIVSHALTDKGAQTAFLGNINFGVNTLALILQLFLAGRIVLTLGVAVALAIVPVVTMAGFAALAASPTLAVIGIFQVVRRGTEYAVTRPAREVLYTVVSREDRYKTKGFIDTFVYRLGDQVGIWSGSMFAEAGVMLAPLAAIGVAAVWLVTALWLGHRQRDLEAERGRLDEGAAHF